MKRIKCFFGKHSYYTIEKVTTNTEKLGCRNCDKHFAMNHDVMAVVPWDIDFDRLRALLKEFEKEVENK